MPDDGVPRWCARRMRKYSRPIARQLEPLRLGGRVATSRSHAYCVRSQRNCQPRSTPKVRKNAMSGDRNYVESSSHRIRYPDWGEKCWYRRLLGTFCRRREKGKAPMKSGLFPIGGDEETRTPDPLHAKQVLYQLSYIPRGNAQNYTQGQAALSKPDKGGRCGLKGSKPT